MSEKYLYILMRNDLGSLSSGRAAAQASHAANAFIHKHGNTKDAKAWTASTPQGFGTAIVLSASMDEISGATKKAESQGFATQLIVDPDYAITISAEIVPFLNKELKGIKIEQSEKDPMKYIIHRQEITCAYIFGNKDELTPILGELPLYS
jgi:peptidyl-tRNA hydrolase